MKWQEVAALLRKIGAVPAAWTGELKLIFRAGKIEKATRTQQLTEL